MALILTDALLTVNAVNFSGFCRKVTLDIQISDIDTTVFGGGGWRSRTGGLIDGTCTLEGLQSFAASNVDATLWPLFTAGVPFTVAVRPTSGSKSATNPEYTGSALLTKYTPLDAQVGDLDVVTIPLSTSGVWARNIV